MGLNKNKEDSILVYLYNVDSIYNDSTIYLKKPYYVTQTLDSTNFEFQNLKPGKYEIIAIKDEGTNYLFDQNTDKIGFVKVGMPVEISIDSFPASDFGVLEGKVKKIGSDALPPSQIDQRTEYRFPATIRLENQSLKLDDGSSLPLQVGMSLSANIKLRKVSYLRLLLSNFKSKADSLKEI